MSIGTKFAIEGTKLQIKYTGVLFKGKESINEYHRITCPCGETVTYPLNDLPEVDTLMPCGNPDHWAVKYEVD